MGIPAEGGETNVSGSVLATCHLAFQDQTSEQLRCEILKSTNPKLSNSSSEMILGEMKSVQTERES